MVRPPADAMAAKVSAHPALISLVSFMIWFSVQTLFAGADDRIPQKVIPLGAAW